MGWNFAYDIIRGWVYNDKQRLAQFDSIYAPIASGGSPIVDYEDFYQVSEQRFIETCGTCPHNSGKALIGGKTRDALVHYLRQRNQYAHASDTHPSISQANTLIEHLIEIIRKEPFDN